MSENSNTPSIDKILNDAKQYLINRFKPATSIQDASIRINTNDLVDSLKSIFPSENITAQFLYQFLIDQGYIQFEIVPFKFEWGFIEVDL